MTGGGAGAGDGAGDGGAAADAARRWAPAAACGLLLAAALLAPHEARAAAAQDWPPFVLVAGLLLVGLVADEDRLFSAGGHALARLAPNGVLLYVGSAVLVVLVTTLLNLDTSVTFLTPVLVYAGRSRGAGQVAPLIYACLLLSNAGSLLLPGSNLTNLIVLGHLHLSGRDFLDHMALPALAAAAVTTLVVGAVYHRALRTTIVSTTQPERPVLGVGLVAVAVVTVLVVALRAPALPVAAVGVAAVLVRAGGTGAVTKALQRGPGTTRRGTAPGPPCRCSASRSWSGSSASPSHSAHWGGPGRGRPPCSPTSTPGAPQPSRP